MSTFHYRTVRWVAFDRGNIPTDWHYQETVWSDGVRDLEYWDDLDDWIFLPRWYRMALPSVSADNWSDDGGVRVTVRPQDSDIIEAEVVENRDIWENIRGGLIRAGDRVKSAFRQLRQWLTGRW